MLAIETAEAAVRDALAQGAQARAQALSLLFVGPEPQAATAAAAAITAVVDVSGTPPASHSRALSAAGALRRDAVLAAQQAAYNAYTGVSLFGLQRGLDAAPALQWLAWVMGWAYKVGFGERRSYRGGCSSPPPHTRHESARLDLLLTQNTHVRPS